MRLKNLVAALLVAVMGLAAMPAAAAPLQVPAPPREGGLELPSAPTVSAPSWIVYDADADLVLGDQSADERRSMASTTKMMTALVVLKYGDLSDRLTVSEEAAAVGEAEVGLIPGERVRLGDLLTALVVRSANDAAMAAAEHIGGSVEGFVEMMNDEARAMGLTNTSFDNPHGLDAEDHYSSARDLLEIGLAAMAYPEFRERAVMLEGSFPDAPDGTERNLSSTNLLLETYPGTIGVKTGFTGRAGLVFVAGAERDGRTLFTVVMGSEGQRGHFEDATSLLDWGFERFRSVAMVGAGTYEPPEPVRLVEEEPEPEPEPEPVVETLVRAPDGELPHLTGALAWVSRLFGGTQGG
jgi:serine-type D-Ala-D-Ala carboxypeptidase (penicillin-binding protein 5/6)